MSTFCFYDHFIYVGLHVEWKITLKWVSNPILEQMFPEVQSHEKALEFEQDCIILFNTKTCIFKIFIVVYYNIKKIEYKIY